MELYSQTAQDENGDIVNGASVSVTVSSSGAPATIYDKDGNALSNPFLTGYDRSKGEVEFAAANGLYNITVTGNPAATKSDQSLLDPTDAEFPSGIGVGGASAQLGGVAFPATADAISDQNTLDDYEEGSWTPSLLFGGAAVGMTGTFTGSYTKIGDCVHVMGSISLTAKGSSTGTALIAGLPFAATEFSAAPYMLNISFADYPNVFGSAGSVFLFETTNAGSRTQLNANNFADNSAITFSTIYFV